MTPKALVITGFITAFVVICFIIYIGSIKWLKIKEVKMEFSNLPTELDGWKILLISDLHANNKKKKNLDIWKKIETLDYDIAVITGDLTVAGFFERLTPHFDDLRELAIRTPVFFVDGNHDRSYYNDVVNLFNEYGITTLNNESIILHGGKLEIIGFRDFSYLKRNNLLDIANELAVNDTAFRIALFHQPQFFDYIDDEHKPDLSLCGHTHGGQIRLPFLPTLYAPGQGIFPKYGDGKYDFDGKKMYISRGIGTTVFPIRFFNRPEIAIIELVK